MLEIVNHEHFDDVKDFAQSIGMLQQLEEKLDYLSKYADHNNEGITKCIIGKDFAPYSFIFAMQKKDDNGEFHHWFSGGLIYHGNHDNGGDGSAPTFSVNLSPTSGWSVHT